MPRGKKLAGKHADDIVAYVCDCYAGVEGRKRQFIWVDEKKDVVIGNCRAFGDHVAVKFGLDANPTFWMHIHALLRALGEVVQVHAAHSRKRGKKFKNQEPEVRVLRHASEDEDH